MFLWGVATSSYQIEGAPENDWTAWETSGRLRSPGVRCGPATGHRQRWPKDFALLPSIGANAYRFSLEWSRLEPEPDRFDEEAFALEAERVRMLEALGIEPVVTLSHYTHPLWFVREGGWEQPGSVERFARLAGRAAEILPAVRFWVTLNEPVVLLLGGFLAGVIPPGRQSFRAAAAAFEHLLRAHGAAAAAIRQRVPGARIGLAHNLLDFAPDRSGSTLDRRLAAAGEALYNTALLEALMSGELAWSVPGEGRLRLALRDLPGATDFVGVNYYSRVHLRFRRIFGRIGEVLYRDPAGRGLTDMGWEMHPEGFARVLSRAAETGLPLLVTENGVATRDDRRRCVFLHEHALVLRQALGRGLPVEGYFYWSLLDNFEWLEGFRPRFGLFEVDYATLARRRRPSADLFAAIGKSFVSRSGP